MTDYTGRDNSVGIVVGVIFWGCFVVFFIIAPMLCALNPPEDNSGTMKILNEKSKISNISKEKYPVVQYDFFNTNKGVLAVGRDPSNGIAILKNEKWSKIKGEISSNIQEQYLFARAVLSVEDKKFGEAHQPDFPFIKGNTEDFQKLEHEIQEVMQKYQPLY